MGLRPLRGARVLLVDDQPANLDVLRRMLEDRGYQVLLAPNGAVALKNAARAKPDLSAMSIMKVAPRSPVRLRRYRGGSAR